MGYFSRGEIFGKCKEMLGEHHFWKNRQGRKRGVVEGGK